MDPRTQGGWRRFAVFCTLSLLLLALVPLLSAAFGTSMNFDALARQAAAETGVSWTSNLWDVVRLCLAQPGLWLLVLGSSVPSLAALTTLAIARDRAGARDLLSRFRPGGDGSNSAASLLATYVLLVGGVLACLELVFLVRTWLSPGAYARGADLSASGFAIALFTGALLDQGAVLEEPGWRGYATPLLQKRVLPPLHAALVVGLAWGLWHVPRDVVSGVIGRLGIVGYLTLFLPVFTLGTVAVSVIASYFMNRANGSLLPAVVAHGLTNDAMGLAGVATIERALTPYHQITKAVPFALLAALLILAAGKRLGLRPRERQQQLTGMERTPVDAVKTSSE